MWNPKKLEIQVNFMEEKDVLVSYSSYELIDEHGNPLHKMLEARKDLDFKKMLKANYIGNLTGMFNAAALGKIYCPPIRKRQDWAMWILAVQKAEKAVGIQQILAKYRLRKDSISGNKQEMLNYNFMIYRKILGFSTLKSSWFFGQFLREQFLVKSQQKKTVE